MSQQEQPQQQPTVRHIPIFVEGRSEPLVNKIPESQPSRDSSTSSMPGDYHQGPPPQQQQPQQQPRMPEMPSHHSTSDFFKHGSIFDRARDFPVRTFPSATANFFNKSSPARESSPARQVPIFTTDASSTATTATVPPAARGSSQPRQTPSPPTAAQQQQQYQQQQAQRFQQQKAQDQPDAAAAATAQPAQPPPPPANDPISKIQKIQRDVLAIFDQVERFQGGKDGKRDKQYLYLDEMLTQNLLKLDSIDAEDQPQIKSARREAIKSINHCIAVLEAKAEAAGGAETETNAPVSGSGSSDKVPNGTANRTGSGASLSHSSSNSSSQQQPQQ